MRRSPSAVRSQCSLNCSSSPSSRLMPERCPINWRSVTGHCFFGKSGTYVCISSSSFSWFFSSSRPTAAEVSAFDAVPILNFVSGVTGSRVSRSAQPKPSAHTISPSTPTATDIPGRFCSVTPARTICRPRSTAPAQPGDGAERVTDGTCSASGCRGVATRLMYANSPKIAAMNRPTAMTPSASMVWVRLFDMFPLRPQLFDP